LFWSNLKNKLFQFQSTTSSGIVEQREADTNFADFFPKQGFFADFLYNEQAKRVHVPKKTVACSATHEPNIFMPKSCDDLR
jgi:hypothetical protein